MIKIKKIIFLYFLTLCSLLNNTLQKPIFNQSDRIYIEQYKLENLIEDQDYDREVTFPTGQFKKSPSVLYSTHKWQCDYLMKGFKITTISVTETKLQFRFSNFGAQYQSVNFLIFAIDDPSVEIVQDTIRFDQGSGTKYERSSPILSLTSFIVGFKSEGNSIITFELNLNKIDNFTFTLDIPQDSLQEIYLNSIIIYENSDKAKYQSLYSYLEVTDTRMVSVYFQNEQWLENTALVDNSQVLFGLRYYNNDDSGGYRGIQVSGNQLVMNNQVNLEYTVEGGNLYISGIQIQFMVQNCEVDEYLFYNEISKIIECIKSCPLRNLNNYDVIQQLYNMSVMVCQGCSDNCLTCYDTFGQPEKCLNCFNGKYLNPYNEKCQDTQPTETYCLKETFEGNIFYNCRKCHESCSECSDGTYTGCIQCKKTNTQPIQYLYKGQCFPYQPPGGYCFPDQ